MPIWDCPHANEPLGQDYDSMSESSYEYNSDPGRCARAPLAPHDRPGTQYGLLGRKYSICGAQDSKATMSSTDAACL